MDVSTTSIDGTTRKVPLEDLPKEELIKKYKGLLTIAQKAKHSKDVVVEENIRLKEQLQQNEVTTNGATQEIIDSLTQQKLDLVTQVETLKHQIKSLSTNLASSECKLNITLTKNNELEIENQSYKRQVNRLTDENEDLIAQLDQLGKQVDELKQLGIEQKQLLLELEKNSETLTSENATLKQEISNLHSETSKLKEFAQVQKMLSVSLEEVKKLHAENASLQETVSNLKRCLSENENVEKLQNDLAKLEALNIKYQQEIKEKNNEIEKYINSTDDLNVQLHRNKAIVEKLKQDLVNTNSKLSDSQIMSSGVTSDLQNSNEKLREKLKFFHSKIVKFAGNVKSLKQDKNILIDNFKEYTEQVMLWKKQLEEISTKLTNELNSIKGENEELQERNAALISNNEQLLKDLNDLKINTECSETESLKNSNKELKEQINELIKEIAELKGNTERLMAERNKLNQKIIEAAENSSELQSELKKIAELETQITNLEVEKQTANEEFLKQKETLESEINKISQHKNNIEAVYSNKVNNLEKTLSDLKEQLNAKTDRTIQLEKIIEETKTQLQLSENKCIDQMQLVDELKTTVQGLEAEKLNYKDMLDTINVLVMNESKFDYQKLVDRLQAISKTSGLENVAELEAKIKSLEVEKQTASEEYLKQKDIEIEYCNKVNTLEKSLSELTEQLNVKATKTNKLEETVKNIRKQFTSCEKKCIKQMQRIQELNKALQELETEKINYKGMLDTINILVLNEPEFDYHKLVQQLQEIPKITDLESTVKQLNSELESAKLTETQLAEKSSQEIIKLVEQIKKLEELNSDLNAKLSFIKDTAEAEVQTEVDANEYEEKISLLKRENAELLTEMNEMNQALKERGETISKQQAYCDEMVKKLQVYETQASKNVSSIALKEETIKNLQEQLTNIKSSGTEKDLQTVVAMKDEEISRLQSEIERLSRETNYAESETLSTSTYSRSEEVNRLKDLEGSWEERYGKLRTLAIKLKGKIRELTTELTKEQNEKAETQQKLGNSVKTVQTLQAKCDQLEDDLEASKTESKNYLKKLDAVAIDISKDKQCLAANEETITKLKSEVEELTKGKVSVEQWKKQVSSKVQSLKKQIEANNLVKKDFEQRIAKLTSDLEEKDQALKAEIEKHKQTKNFLQESNNECKKKSVLNLEMQDYERSVKELSQKLENEKDVINKLKNQLDSQKGTISALREQNKLLEERTQAQEADFASLKSEITINKKKINDLEDTISQKDSKIQLLTQNLEETRLENEELSTELSKVIAEHQKINNTLKAEKDYLRSQNLGLEQRLREVQDAFKLKNHEFDTIEAEYQAYKVRAQSVLRQNQTRDLGLEEKLHEEVASLNTRVGNLTEELNANK